MPLESITGLQPLDPSINTGLENLLNYENDKLTKLQQGSGTASTAGFSLPSLPSLPSLGDLAGNVVKSNTAPLAGLTGFSFGRIISIVLGLLLIGGGLILFAGEDIGETIAKAPELIAGV